MFRRKAAGKTNREIGARFGLSKAQFYDVAAAAPLFVVKPVFVRLLCTQLCCRQQSVALSDRNKTARSCVASAACIKAMIVPGRLKCFGTLGREENVVIPWDKIEIIGCDTILVCIEPGYNRRKQRRLLEMFKR